MTPSTEPSTPAPGHGTLRAVDDEPFAGFPRATVEAALSQVLSSATFRRSERHRRLMRYLVQATLDGHGDRLKEAPLAVALFGRDLATWDPRRDPVVRVEALRLRDKLARFYGGEGVGQAFVFTVPTGGYLPRLVRRSRDAVGERAVESFAVLPFATNDDSNAAFTVGLADQLIDALGRVRHLKVVSRVSAFATRDRQLGIADVGRLLRVTRVVDGSIHRHGDRLRCIAHIYRAQDGLVTWSQTFDTAVGDDDDIDWFAFQDRVTEAIVAAASPDGAPARRVVDLDAARRPTADRRRARDLLDRARYLSRRYDATATARVMALIEEAVALDDGDASALLSLATAYIDEAALLNAPSETLLPRIRALVARAIQLDPADGNALGLQALVAFRFDFDWPRAALLFRDAVRLAPHAIGVNYRYAFGLIFDGQFDAGFRHLDLAIELDPLNLRVRASRIHLSGYARCYERAEAEALAVLEFEPGHLYTQFVLGLIDLYRQRPGAALRRFDGVIARLPDHPAARFARICALGLDGETGRGRAELDALTAQLGGRYCPPFSLAVAAAGLGDRALCHAALERAGRERDASFCSLPVDPLFARFHDDPAFTALLARHGLRPPVVVVGLDA